MDYSWRKEKFDSEVLGFRVAKILNIKSRGSSEQLRTRIKNLIGELTEKKIDYASIRSESTNYPLAHALEENGFILVDGLITLSLEVSDLRFEKPDERIRAAIPRDVHDLKKITKGLYSTSRIFNDPLIPKDRANKFYIKWIENSVLGKAADSVLVWKEDKILGYVTLQKKGAAQRGSARGGQIPLLGVSEQARGKGIAKKLLNAALRKFKSWGVRQVVIETQMDNIPALRTYQSVGFKIMDSHFTFRWSNSP